MAIFVTISVAIAGGMLQQMSSVFFLYCWEFYKFELRVCCWRVYKPLH